MALIDVYLGSKELKKTIVERSFKYEIPLRYLCAEIGVNYKTFLSAYVNSPSQVHMPITEKQFEKMLDILGIDVRTQFVIRKDYKADETRKYLEERHGNRKKEGPAAAATSGDTPLG